MFGLDSQELYRLYCIIKNDEILNDFFVKISTKYIENWKEIFAPFNQKEEKLESDIEECVEKINSNIYKLNQMGISTKTNQNDDYEGEYIQSFVYNTIVFTDEEIQCLEQYIKENENSNAEVIIPSPFEGVIETLKNQIENKYKKEKRKIKKLEKLKKKDTDYFPLTKQEEKKMMTLAEKLNPLKTDIESLEFLEKRKSFFDQLSFNCCKLILENFKLNDKIKKLEIRKKSESFNFFGAKESFKTAIIKESYKEFVKNIDEKQLEIIKIKFYKSILKAKTEDFPVERTFAFGEEVVEWFLEEIKEEFYEFVKILIEVEEAKTLKKTN